MKKIHRWIIALVVLGFVLTGLFFTAAPEQIPAHYDSRGQVDRWGSKYEYILLPVINLIFTGSMAYLARREEKQGRDMNAGVILGMTAIVLLMFNLIWVVFMALAMKGGVQTPGLAIKTVTILLALSLVPLGNKMPKSTRNSAYGLRTSWSMASDRCWQKSQRVAGYTFVIGGIGGSVLCALLPALWCGWAFLVVMACVVLAAMAVSRRVCREETGE